MPEHRVRRQAGAPTGAKHEIEMPVEPDDRCEEIQDIVEVKTPKFRDMPSPPYLLVRDR